MANNGEIRRVLGKSQKNITPNKKDLEDSNSVCNITAEENDKKVEAVNVKSERQDAVSELTSSDNDIDNGNGNDNYIFPFLAERIPKIFLQNLQSFAYSYILS